MSSLRRALLVVAAVLMLVGTAVPRGQAYEGGIKLFPLLYRSQSGNDVEALCGLYGSHTRGAEFDRRVVPVFWGDDYLHLAPVYWSQEGNWVLVPLAWDWQGNRGVGPAWWGEDYFVMAPLFVRQGDNWVFIPAAWDWNGNKGVGPVWWDDHGFFAVFPVYFQSENGWVLIPLGWSLGTSKAIGPVWWGKDYLHVFPVYWSRNDNWLLLPLAWNWDGHRGAGPVWWSEDYFRVFPLFWKRDANWTLIPLAWNANGNKGVGPVWWGKNYLHVFPLSFHWDNKTPIPPLLAYSRTTADSSETLALVRLLRWSRDPDGYEFEFQPLLDVAGGKVGHFSLLWRLFEYHRDPQESYWRCLFLPFKLGRRPTGLGQ